MTLPNFLIIGAMKAGTTSLWRSLASHPQVFMARNKEVEFFLEEQYERGLEWYSRFFEETTDELAIGEASTHYSMYPGRTGVPERIAETIPDVKLIYLVRNPIDRLRSHYLHSASRGYVGAPLTEVALSSDYLSASMYWMQLSRYLEHFDAANIHVVVSEDLFSTPEPTLVRLCGFLGIETHSTAVMRSNSTANRSYVHPVISSMRTSKIGNAAVRLIPTAMKSRMKASAPRTSFSRVEPKASITPQLRAELEAALRADVAALRDFLGPTFHGWGLLD